MTEPTASGAGSIADEFSGADLGDIRRTRRLQKMADALSMEPSASFPKAMKDDAGLEGAYRFLGNESVSPRAIVAPHFERSCDRARALDWSLVVHDTSEFSFPGEVHREGLGRTRGADSQGFFGHFALGVAPGEARQPLGVLALKTLFREGQAKGKRSHRELAADGGNESRRWGELVEEVERRLGERGRAVHVMDREGDNYALFADLTGKGYRFVIRLAHDRALALPCLDGTKAHPKISSALESAAPALVRDVRISRRRKPSTPSAKKIFPGRPSRLASLHFVAQSVEILRPTSQGSDLPPSLQLNAVRVAEDPATAGEFEPVEWTLVTSEPIETVADIERIVDSYRSRWVIEEYFKALKTGCAYEKRQLESKESLLNALAVFVPIAWHLLQLRSLARSQPEAPATDVLSSTQLKVLRATAKAKLPASPTIRQVMLAIAGLGGHLKRNGDPGWQVLGRGYEKLLAYELGWLAAAHEM